MKKLIRRHQLGNMLQTAAVAEQPSVMTATGFSVEPNGNIKWDRINDQDVQQLRNNLFSIGEAAITAPTITSDIGGLWNIVIHPKKLLRLRKPKFNFSAYVNDIMDNVNGKKLFINKDVSKGVQEGFADAYKYYSSDRYIEHLMSTGLSKEEALKLQKLKIDNIFQTKLKFDMKDNNYGHISVDNEGNITAYVNPELSNTKELAREAVWHEIGGHASSRGYSSINDNVINNSPILRNVYSNPWYKKISEHTKSIMPELKPQWKSFMKGDMDTFRKLATKEDLDFANNIKNPEEFLRYLNTEQEVAARAIANNIGDYAGLPSKWNLQQLEQFFTKDGVLNLRNKVWSIAAPGIAFGYYDFLPIKKDKK